MVYYFVRRGLDVLELYMAQTITRIGPADNGRRMLLKEFEHAEGEAGHVYELGKGVVNVMDVPGLPHMAQFEALRDQFVAYRLANPSRIKHIVGGGESKVLLEEMQSERHPDISVYRHPPDEPGNWATWIPDIVVEIISPSSRQRDLDEKPEEYLRFGVSEYWVVDRQEDQMLVHRRVGGRWQLRVVKPPEQYETLLLPGLKIDLRAVFTAAAEYER